MPALKQTLLLLITMFALSAASQLTLAQETTTKPDSEGWIPLYNGKDLDGWKTPNFGGERPSTVKKSGELVIEMGAPMNGLTYTKDFPKNNYEIELKARRLLGNDFFVGLTFPVNDKFLSFVAGGWGGVVVGISSLDGEDANNNDLRQIRQFKEAQYYKVNLKVTPELITIAIDDEQVIKFDPRKHRLSTRVEVDLSKPLGLSTYETEAGFEYIKYRSLESATKP
ncbi:3-keto-disaccharide hydrolase [Lacunimicrobium album]